MPTLGELKKKKRRGEEVKVSFDGKNFESENEMEREL